MNNFLILEVMLLQAVFVFVLQYVAITNAEGYQVDDDSHSHIQYGKFAYPYSYEHDGFSVPFLDDALVSLVQTWIQYSCLLAQKYHKH